MDWIDRVCAAVPRLSGGLDAIEMAAFNELDMARAPLRRLVGPGLPVRAIGPQAVPVRPDPVPGRGRPGKRW
jgi:hypothetical protein